LAQVVRKTSHAVAELFAIRERGFLREGYWADFALVERLAVPRPVAADPVLAHCGWTPFAQRSFHHVVRSTVVSGQLAWHEGGCRTAARAAVDVRALIDGCQTPTASYPWVGRAAVRRERRNAPNFTGVHQ
jgi:N-acyl-D-aspartate/D-glutamate deacylase